MDDANSQIETNAFLCRVACSIKLNWINGVSERAPVLPKFYDLNNCEIATGYRVLLDKEGNWLKASNYKGGGSKVLVDIYVYPAELAALQKNEAKFKI